MRICIHIEVPDRAVPVTMIIAGSTIHTKASASHHDTVALNATTAALPEEAAVVFGRSVVLCAASAVFFGALGGVVYGDDLGNQLSIGGHLEPKPSACRRGGILITGVAALLGKGRRLCRHR